MGYYSELYIAGYRFLSAKNGVTQGMATLFQASDKQHRLASAADLAMRGWGAHNGDPIVEDVELYEYTSTTRTAIRRLDIMGFGLDRARREFEASRLQQLSSLETRLDECPNIKGLAESYENELRLVQALTYPDWEAAIDWIVRNGISPYEVDRIDPRGIPEVPRYLLHEAAGSESSWGWLPGDERTVLRGILEIFPEQNVILDCTDLVVGGYYDEAEDICGADTPILVLTEGSTDARILSKSLLVLHPELADYYSFMDFDSMRVPGGASQLVSAIKVFAGAGIENRIIAIFDNDTSAKEAQRCLPAETLPNNIRVLSLPKVDIAAAYPTLGPQGLVTMDVNGLACSIEMYFGRDVLTDVAGDLVPVQWTGYSGGIGQYQGEVLKKSELQKRYMDLLDDSLKHHEVSLERDWAPMDAILEAVFVAFSD